MIEFEEAIQRTAPPRLAIVVHAFYPEIFRKFVDRLDRLSLDFKIFVSATAPHIEEVRTILERKPYRKEIIEVENRGRDIAPFLLLMREIIKEEIPFVLKLHTKQSRHHTFGDSWRDDMIDYLLDARRLDELLGIFKRHPEIGIAGPPTYLVPMHTYWRTNKDKVKWLARRMGIQTIDLSNDTFFAGTMFLARTDALRPLINLGINLSDFEAEEDQFDGTLAHAIERAISYSVRASGFTIHGADQFDVITQNYGKFGKVWYARLRRMLRYTTSNNS